jgi:hypothetical protein
MGCACSKKKRREDEIVELTLDDDPKPRKFSKESDKPSETIHSEDPFL